MKKTERKNKDAINKTHENKKAENDKSGIKPSIKNKYIIMGIITAVLIVLFFVFFSRWQSNIIQDSQTHVPDEAADMFENQPGEALLEQSPPTTHEAGLFVDPPPETIIPFASTPGEAEAITVEIAAGAQLYYDNYHKQAEILGKNGYLYDWPARFYVQPGEIFYPEDEPEAHERYKDMKLPVLYIDPADAQAVLPPGAFEDFIPGAMAIFTAFPLEDGYIIANAQGKLGELTREDFESLLAKYNSDHGPVARYGKEHPEYAVILQSVADHMEADDITIRYMAADGKYAFVAAAPQNDPKAVDCYVLARKGNGFEVILADFTNASQFRKTVVTSVPDFNHNMFPPYDMFFHRKYIQDDFAAIPVSMLVTGMIEEADGVPSFIAGTHEFIYMTLSEGKKFTGHKQENGEWRVTPVINYLEAEDYIRERATLSLNPPLFIVKQE